MCISANVDFVASLVVGAVGVATLAHVRQPRAVLFAAVPLFFAMHQLSEGFVWLGVRGLIRPEAKGHVTFLFMLYAQGILPFLMPLAVLLMEDAGWRRRVIAVMTVLGAFLCGYVLWGLIAYPSEVTVSHHSLDYENPATSHWWVGAIYVVAVCGALVASSHKVVRWFGWLNVVGVLATMVVKTYAFTSVWCLYAALVSVILYWQFRSRHIDIARPNSVLDGLRTAV